MTGPYDEYAYLMKTRGYYLIENAIPDPVLLSQLRSGIDRAMDEDLAAAKSGVYRNYNNENVARHMLVRGHEFLRLIEESAIQRHIDFLLGDTCVIFNYTAVRLLPGKKNVVANVHRDSHRFSPDYLLMLQVLYFIDDFTVENGATWLLPGSHHVAEPVSDDFFFKHAIRVAGKAGTALIFDSSLWHAGGANLTDRPRRGIALVYVRSFMKQMFDLPKAIPPQVLDGLSEKAKRLVGYHVRVPVSLEEFYVPESERLYQKNQG